MKITIKKAVYTKAYYEYLMEAASKRKIHKPPKETQLISETIEIPDKLVDKTIAVIDELLDRTYNDWEERGWSEVDFPLIPFPFFHKSRLPENVGVDDYWISDWLGTTLMDTIRERTKIIEILNASGGIEKVKHNPSINLNVGIFDGDKFDLVIKRGELISLRRLIIEKQQKPTNGERGIIPTPSVRKTALQNIASEIKEFTSHSGLEEFFSDLNIPKELFAVGSKYDKVFSVLSSVSQDVLSKIIEEALHPLRFFGGNEERALQMQDLFSSFLQFDGYCIHKGKIVRATPELLKEIKTRIEKRKEKAANQISDNKEIAPTREPFPIEITKMPELKIKGLDKLPQKKKKQIKENVLYLNKVGDLYREPREKYCYPMSESEGRHKIVRYFADNKIYSYYPTRELAMALEKDEASFMKEVGKINSMIQGRLKLKGRIIEGRRRSGYRLNPKYKIVLKNE